MPLFQISKETIFSEVFESLLNGFDIALVLVFSINKNIIELYNNINITLLSLDLIDITLKTSQSIR